MQTRESKAAPPGMKWCPRCRQYKLLGDFCSQLNGIKPFCYVCQKEYTKEYNAKYYRDHRADLLPPHRLSAQRSRDKKKEEAKDGG